MTNNRRVFLDMSDYSLSAKAYWWLTATAGISVALATLIDVAHLQSDELFKLLMLTLAVFFAGSLMIRIPGTQVSFSPCDIFVFLGCLFAGIPAAVFLAVTDALVTSCRTSRRWTSRIGGPSLMAISIFSSAYLFIWLKTVLSRFEIANGTVIFASLLAFSLCHFLLNTTLLTILQALKTKVSPFKIWRANYSWTGLTFATSASAAGAIYFAIESYGLALLIAAAPIVAIIFAAYHFYHKQVEERAKADRARLEAAETQAEQARQHAQELAESEERFRSAFNYAAIGMALVAPDGRWLQVNRALCRILGYDESELLARDFQSLTYAEDRELASRHLAQILAKNVHVAPIEKRYIHKLGHAVWVLLSVSLITEAKSHAPRFIFQIQDITDRKRAEQKLAHDALHDSLTGLPNRALFMDHLKMAIARASRLSEKVFAVLFLDFDRFKVVNDSLGHLVGDKLLIAIARRLEGCLRPADTIARLGGDEFTILLEEIKSTDEATQLAERIQKELTAPFNINDHEVYIAASIGIASSQIGYQKPEEILRDADTAMYHAKSLGKARYVLFDKRMHTQALKTLQMETDLRHAVERQEFFLVYQPIVSLRTLRLIGFEALLRWQHPERGIVSPAEFIPVAEETGYIAQIGEWTLEEACRQIQRWQQHLPEKLPFAVSVNLSGKQLVRGDLQEKVLQILERTKTDPQQLKLEITESVVMENIETASGILEELRSLGIQLSIDDFGTGYSSLSYLHRLPIDTLKIDRSFVQQMTENGENAEIVRTIIALAKNLNMAVIAEGVETGEQLCNLQQLDCENGQGYLFSKPIGADEAGKLVSSSHHWQALRQSSPALPEDQLLDPASKYTM